MSILLDKRRPMPPTSPNTPEQADSARNTVNHGVTGPSSVSRPSIYDDLNARPSEVLSKDTPAKAIHAFCVDCVCSLNGVRDCGGEYLHDLQKPCPAYPWRMGYGPKVAARKGIDAGDPAAWKSPRKTARLICEHCMGAPGVGSRALLNRVIECQSMDCPLHLYRTGKRGPMGRTLTDEQRAAVAERFRTARETKKAAEEGAQK